MPCSMLRISLKMVVEACHTCVPSGAGVLMPRDETAWTKDRVDRENCKPEQTCICVYTLSIVPSSHSNTRIPQARGCCSSMPLCRHNPSYTSVRYQLTELHTLLTPTDCAYAHPDYQLLPMAARQCVNAARDPIAPVSTLSMKAKPESGKAASAR